MRCHSFFPAQHCILAYRKVFSNKMRTGCAMVPGNHTDCFPFPRAVCRCGSLCISHAAQLPAQRLHKQGQSIALTTLPQLTPQAHSIPRTCPVPMQHRGRNTWGLLLRSTYSI